MSKIKNFHLDHSAAADRSRSLADLDLDYRGMQNEFGGLADLAAQIAETPISMVNLLDAYESWTIAHHGFELSAFAVEDTVCLYTVQSGENLEINSLGKDLRFSERAYVSDGGLKYYYGVPLKTEDGFPIGTLCVFDKEEKILNEKQKAMLQLIAKEVMDRLGLIRDIKKASASIQQLIDERRIIAHDIRGPVAGMIGLARLINDPDHDNSNEEKTEYIHLIEESGQQVLALADDVLGSVIKSGSERTTLNELSEKFRQLFMPRLKEKEQQLLVSISEDSADISFPSAGIGQIIGNLLSNAIKFTPLKGQIKLSLQAETDDSKMALRIIVSDNGNGMSKEKIAEISMGKSSSTIGTEGEPGYGMGLQLVRDLVNKLGGQLEITSVLPKGTMFTAFLPVH